jgi:hypothetical protein
VSLVILDQQEERETLVL